VISNRLDLFVSWLLRGGELRYSTRISRKPQRRAERFSRSTPSLATSLAGKAGCYRPLASPASMARKTHKKSLQEYMEENGIGVGDPDDDEESVVAPIVQETPRLVTRALRTEHLQPLIDLVFSDSTEVQRNATRLLGTLALNADNIDILIDSGSLGPLLTMAGSTDSSVRRAALAGLAHMSSRDDIRTKLCAVAGGLQTVVAGVTCSDGPSRLAAAECMANIATSLKLRGRLIDSKVGGLPALLSLLTSRTSELKRWGMLTLQRLAVCRKTNGAIITTKDDPEGDGYADELLKAGVLQPLLTMLRAGTMSLEEDLRTQVSVVNCL